MQIVDIAQQVLSATEKGQILSTADYYADNFTLTGPVPMPVDKNQYLDLMSKVFHGIPDWKFNQHDLRVEGQTVIAPVQVTGTQTQTLPGLMPGMPDLPATNRSVRLPPEVMRITFQGDRIVNVHVDPVPGGGIMGVLEQLGVPVPVTGKPPDKPAK